MGYCNPRPFFGTRDSDLKRPFRYSQGPRLEGPAIPRGDYRESRQLRGILRRSSHPGRCGDLLGRTESAKPVLRLCSVKSRAKAQNEN